MYGTYEDYILYYGEIPEADFNRYAIEAGRAMDIATTGIDNVRKLKVAFPEDDADVITYCFCQLVNLVKQVAEAEAATGYAAGANGLQGKAVASMSAGNESVTYTAGESAISEAVFNAAKKGELLTNTAKTILSGIEDANGVNLLYMGRYPGGLNV